MTRFTFVNKLFNLNFTSSFVRFNQIIALVLIVLLSACSTSKPLVPVPSSPPPPPPLPEIQVALVLGGGGSKGMAHIGALEVLEDHGIPIDLIVGCSIGSAVGALYADNPDAKLLKSKLIGVKREHLLDPSIFESIQMFFSLKGMIRGYLYQKFLLKHLNTRDLESLKIPLVVVTTDLDTNHLYALRSGPIVPAILASSAIPPIFSPVKLYGKTLADGGVKAPVPVGVARQYQPKLVIAVDIGAPPPHDPLNNMLDVTYRAFWIFYYELSKVQASNADIVIHPNLYGFGTFDDGSRNLDVYNAGKKAALEMLPFIQQKLEYLKIPLKKGFALK